MPNPGSQLEESAWQWWVQFFFESTTYGSISVSSKLMPKSKFLCVCVGVCVGVQLQLLLCFLSLLQRNHLSTFKLSLLPTQDSQGREFVASSEPQFDYTFGS
jgi:hypothetical protein